VEAVRRSLKFWFYRNVVPVGGVLFVKALSATYRIGIIDPADEQRALHRHQNLIYATWHQRFFPGITLFSDRKPIAVMISQSRDGEMIARVTEKFGWEPVRGSSTRGGVAALRRLRSLASQGYNFAHIVDGPKGPFGRVKPGLLHLSRMVGKPIVPTITSAEKQWVFNSWDRFMVPKPFSRILIRFGEPIVMPPKIDPDVFEQKRRLVEERLKNLYEDTDRIWQNPERLAAVFARPVD
jgi:lysophospholipid acyltransferase (LPLAT)-like uncharacterized protein